MKLGNVIILNRQHLKEFFSFPEFCEKKNEFVDLANSDFFFKTKDRENNKIQLKAQVIDWINKRNLTSDKQLSPGFIVLPNAKISRNYSLYCEDLLKQLSFEDAFGIVCLYEMMERNLKQDIYEIMTCLGHEVVNPQSGVIIVQNNTTKDFTNKLDISNSDASESLYNVLVVNMSSDHEGVASIVFENEEVTLKSGECIRALFYGNRCIKLFSQSNSNLKFYLKEGTYTTGVKLNGTPLPIEGNVLSFASGKKGNIYAVKDGNKKFVADHMIISDIGNYLNRIDEVIVYIEISPSEKEFIALTKNKKLYHYTSDDYNGKVELFRENVIYATYRNNEIMTINETEIK